MKTAYLVEGVGPTRADCLWVGRVARAPVEEVIILQVSGLFLQVSARPNLQHLADSCPESAPGIRAGTFPAQGTYRALEASTHGY